MTGQPSGPPEWPLPGGMLRQPAKLVAAADLLRSELRYLRSKKDTVDAKSSRKSGHRSSRR